MRLGRAARYWPYAGGLAAALLAVGAFLAWGPVGMGSGPLSVASLDASQVLGTKVQPWGLFIELDAGQSGAVIDRVTLLGGRGYRPPRVIALWADSDEECGGMFPWRGQTSILRSCAPGGLTQLLGKAVPAVSVAAPDGVDHRYPGIAAVVEVGPPGPGGCWVVTSVVIHYHVGIRHYATTTPETLAACETDQERDAAQTTLGLGT